MTRDIYTLLYCAVLKNYNSLNCSMLTLENVLYFPIVAYVNTINFADKISGIVMELFSSFHCYSLFYYQSLLLATNH
jgi:hypothetical protein